MAAALGNIGWYAVTPYPRTFPQMLALSQKIIKEFERRLLLVGTGRPVLNNDLFQAEFPGGATDSAVFKVLWELRALPWLAADALKEEKYTELGEVMTQHTKLLGKVYQETDSPEARRISIMARRWHAPGIAVNTAGSKVLILCDPDNKTNLTQGLHEGGFSVLPVHIDQYGLRIWIEEEDEQRAPIPEEGEAMAA